MRSIPRRAGPPPALDASERLPQGEVKLEDTDALHHGRAPAEQELVLRALKPEEAWGVGAERKVDAHRPDGRAISNAEAEALHRVVEVLEIALPEAQADSIDVRVDVAQIVEEHAPDVFPEQRKSQLQGIYEQRVPADRKPGLEIARPGLKIWESAIRKRATAEEALRQRDLRQAGI